MKVVKQFFLWRHGKKDLAPVRRMLSTIEYFFFFFGLGNGCLFRLYLVEGLWAQWLHEEEGFANYCSDISTVHMLTHDSLVG